VRPICRSPILRCGWNCANHCELEELSKQLARESAQSAKDAADAAPKKAREWFSEHWYVYASACGALTTYFGYQMFELTQSGFGTAGAMAGALAGFFHGRNLELNRDLQVAAAAKAQAQADVNVNEELNKPQEPPLFSSSELAEVKLAAARQRKLWVRRIFRRRSRPH
jgi:hypothetical protein